MKISKNEWLIYGVYCNVNTFNGEIIIKNLKFQFNENARENIENIIKRLNYIDEKGYSLNVRIESYFSKINLTFEISEKEKYIYKDIYIVSLMIN